MSKTYLFAGASSKIALSAAELLQEQNNRVIGISTKILSSGYTTYHIVPSYNFNSFPAIEEEIDGLVYFPGTINLKPFHRLSEADFLNDFQISSLGAAAFVQAYLPQLKKSKQASIVFISTVAVSTGMPFHSSVAMAKGALEGLTKSLAAELAPGIRVNCIAPSLTNTPMGEKFINTSDKLLASQNRNPLKKVGDPKDIANMVEFLLSDKSAWITGQVLAVDGGMNHLKII
jgi:3-oxoacyl-[acyl-carrier protein] reductase